MNYINQNQKDYIPVYYRKETLKHTGHKLRRVASPFKWQPNDHRSKQVGEFTKNATQMNKRWFSNSESCENAIISNTFVNSSTKQAFFINVTKHLQRD